MSIALNDVFQFRYFGRMDNQVILAVQTMRVSTLPGAGIDDYLFTQDLILKTKVRANNAFLDTYLAAASADFLMEYVQIQKVTPTRAIYAQGDIAINGDDVNGVVTANVAASIEKRSAVVGPAGVGRLQFGAIPNTEMASGLVANGYLTGALAALATAMVGTVNLSTAYPLARMTYCLPSHTALANYDLVNAIPKQTVRTMHRRTVGLGI